MKTLTDLESELADAEDALDNVESDIGDINERLEDAKAYHKEEITEAKK